MDRGDWLTVIVAVIAALPGLVALWQNRKKNDADTEKVKAETENIHAQVADHWAEHVAELQAEVKGLRMDLNQVRRENEQYRKQLVERDEVIASMKKWIGRMMETVRTEAPHVHLEDWSEAWAPHTEE